MSSLPTDDLGELLRSRGMRSTPQRRAILGVFHGGRTEHLSAEEVYARATRLLPDLSRATVYATLAEFSELALLSAFGSPEPVRYETTVEPHAHLRCHLCMRLFDLVGAQQDPEEIDASGFIVERVETRAEGICDECTDYDAGLGAGAQSMLDSGPPPETLAVAGAAATEVESPLGKLLLAATSQGLTRIAFEEHHDAAALSAHAASRRGSKTARQHLTDARESLLRYFAGDLNVRGCAIDWQQLTPAGASLQATQAIPYATHCSYNDLGLQLAPHELGLILGSNPIPIVTPCHRVSRGTEIPTTYVGGPDRRRWLDTHELTHSST